MTDATTLVRELYAIQDRLREAFRQPRRFPLDGKLVGDLGEVIAAERYGLELVDNVSTKGHDAFRRDASGAVVRVEVKATQAGTPQASIAFSSTTLEHPPDEFIVLVIQRDGSADEAYNGPASPILEKLKRMASPDGKRKAPPAGKQLKLSLAAIKRIARTVPRGK